MAESISEQLKASRSAGEGRDSSPCTTPVVACPFAPNTVSITLVNEDGEPVAGQPYVLVDLAGVERRGVSDPGGKIEEAGLRNGVSSFRLAGLDQSCWEGEAVAQVPGRAALEHTVAPGDTISTLALAYGLLPGALWNDEGNAALRERRGTPDLLGEGDLVQVPASTEKQVTVAANARLEVLVRGPSLEVVQLRLLDSAGLPRANLPWLLEVSGVLLEGETDEHGMVLAAVPVRAPFAKLVVEGEESDETMILALRQLAPIDAPLGQRQRLSNLGFAVAGDSPAALELALKNFQSSKKLTPSGQADAETLARLTAEHGR